MSIKKKNTKKRTSSTLEARFKLIWRAIKGVKLEEEFIFHHTRQWRADFVHHDTRTLIEVEGGIYMQGRHTRGKGFAADCEKYLEAHLCGYRVIRLVDKQLNPETLARLNASLLEAMTTDDFSDMMK